MEVSQELDVRQELDASEDIFNDRGIVLTPEQVECIAQMVSNGYGIGSIVLAAGLADAGEYERAIVEDDVKKRVQEIKGERVVDDIELDSEWGQVEELAVAALKHDVQYGSSELTPMEKLRIAKEANTRKKHAGDDVVRGGAGSLDGDIVNGVKQVINLQMPFVVMQRFKQVSEDNGRVIEGELIREKEFSKVNKDNLTTEDVQKVLDVELDGDADKGNSVFEVNTEGLFDNIFGNNSPTGVSEVEG